MSSNLPPPEDIEWEKLHDEVDSYPVENSRQIWEAGKLLFKTFNQLMEDDKVIISERLQELEMRMKDSEDLIDLLKKKIKTIESAG